MAHNFKKIGERYISKAGHDSNDGLTPETPKKSISPENASGYGYDTIIGAGHYVGGDLGNPNSQTTITGDGKVVLDSMSSINVRETSEYDTNIEVRNCPSINGRRVVWNNTIIKNSVINLTSEYFAIIESIIIESTFNKPFPEKCVVYSCSGTVTRVIDSYVDISTELTYDGDISLFHHNNYRGIISFLGSNYPDGLLHKYAIQDQLQGTPQDNGYPKGVKWLSEAQLTADGYTGAIAGWDTQIATCINREPLFNNEELYDFTLQAGSPHIGRAEDGSNIGGTKIARTVLNTDNTSINIDVTASSTVNTSNPNSFYTNEEDGYIDYIAKIGSNNLVLGEISPITALSFNSDFKGGGIENNNVPDSEPLTQDYPETLITDAVSPDNMTLMLTGHTVPIGSYVRVAGEVREVTNVTSDSIIVATAFRSTVQSGVSFEYGTEFQIAALSPNRLTYQLRTSKLNEQPSQDSHWDNDIDPVYAMAGKFLTQEWNTVPVYYIQNDVVYGGGDSETPSSLSENEISCKWVHIRVYIRNNYKS